MNSQNLHCPSSKEIKKEKKNLNIKCFIVFPFLLVSFLSFIFGFCALLIHNSIFAYGQGIEPLNDSQSSIAGLMLFGGIISLMLFGFIFSNYFKEMELFKEINQEDCKEMLKLLKATPEGKEYHQTVLSENRQFIYYDLALLSDWTQSAPQRDSCKELYNI